MTDRRPPRRLEPDERHDNDDSVHARGSDHGHAPSGLPSPDGWGPPPTEPPTIAPPARPAPAEAVPAGAPGPPPPPYRPDGHHGGGATQGAWSPPAVAPPPPAGIGPSGQPPGPWGSAPPTYPWTGPGGPPPMAPGAHEPWAWTPPSAPPPPDDGKGPPPGRFGLLSVFGGLLGFVVVQILVGIAVFVTLLAFGVVELGSGELNDDELTTVTNWTLPLAAVAGWAVFIGVPLLVSKRQGSGNAARDLGLAGRPVDLAWGVVGWLGCLAVAGVLGVGYSVLFDEETPTNTDIITSDASQIGLFLMLLVIIGIGTPIAEEVFFRGLVFGAFYQRFGTVGAVALSSLLFGAMHVFALVGEGPLAMLYIAVVTGGLGVVFALLRLYTGRLAAPIVAHMIFNSVSVVAITFLI
ncbi:MAG: CPBP family intramembrane metalloprotease [Acidimicrobiia bacterium]|nr:CPBP family intramembrane metalloprotease [Acidimicrobiia bacterium]